jgi:hypothetical protein
MTDEEVTQIMRTYSVEESKKYDSLVVCLMANEFDGDLMNDSLVIRCYYCGRKSFNWDICRGCQRPVCVSCRPGSRHTGLGTACRADIPEKEWEVDRD